MCGTTVCITAYLYAYISSHKEHKSYNLIKIQENVSFILTLAAIFVIMWLTNGGKDKLQVVNIDK